MGKRVRTLVYLVIALIWVVLGAVGLETFAAFNKRRADAAAATYRQQRQAEAGRAEQELLKAMGLDPLPQVKPVPPSTAGFADMDDEARKTLAAQREDVIAVCDRDGIVKTVYAAPEPPVIARLAAAIRVGTPIVENLAKPDPSDPDWGDEYGDCVAVVRTAIETGIGQPRTYSIVLPDGTPTVMDLQFEPLKDAAGAVTGLAVFAHDSLWLQRVFKYKPGVYARFGQDEFIINTLGWRDAEVTLPKPPGVYRIVCVGASTTVEGLRNNLTYPKRLEARLRQRFNTDRIEVINCGVIGIHSDGEARRAPDYLALQPDLMLHYNFINDVTQLFFRHVQPGNLEDSFVKRVKWQLRKSWFAYRYFNAWLWPDRAQWTAILQANTLANLRQLCAAVRATGVDVAISSFAFPDVRRLSEDERRNFDLCAARFFGAGGAGRGICNAAGYVYIVGVYNDLARDLCREQGYFYVPVAEEFQGGSEYFSDICHMYQMGIERKADIMAAHLADFIAARWAPHHPANP